MRLKPEAKVIRFIEVVKYTSYSLHSTSEKDTKLITHISVYKYIVLQ